MFDLQGYCTIRRDANCEFAMGKPEEWRNKDCRVYEFNPAGDALVLHPEGKMMAMFDKKDICRRFECGEFGDVIMPPGLNMVEQMVYYNKATMRKGGYGTIVRAMVVQASLMKGKFNDDFLFQIEREENLKKKYATDKT